MSRSPHGWGTPGQDCHMHRWLRGGNPLQVFPFPSVTAAAEPPHLLHAALRQMVWVKTVDSFAGNAAIECSPWHYLIPQPLHDAKTHRLQAVYFVSCAAHQQRWVKNRGDISLASFDHPSTMKRSDGINGSAEDARRNVDIKRN